MLNLVYGDRFRRVCGYIVLMVLLIVGLNETEVLAILDLSLEEIVAIFLDLSMIRVLMVVVR